MTVLNIIKEAIEIEASSIKALLEQVGPDYESAVHLIESSEGKVIITGVGKSGHVGKKNCRVPCKYRNPCFFLSTVQKEYTVI